jgi:Cell wall hydrolyses involved in spore germination
MSGFKGLALVLLSVVSCATHAQEVIVTQPIQTDAPEVVKSELPPVIPAPEDTSQPEMAIVVPSTHPNFEELLELAKKENANRANMKKAKLSEVECLATAMYHEARGEGERGIKAVAFVIYNRTKSQRFATNSICSVIMQKSQFSFVSDKNPDNIKDWKMYNAILAMAYDLVHNGGFQSKQSPVGNALFFNSLSKRAKNFITRIGNHYFYK